MPYSKQPLTVLMIEDNEGDFVLFETYLRQTNLQVETLLHATSLEEAGRFAGAAIDITFLDLSLPDSGGVESFITLNRLMPQVPVVVLSGMADESMALQCISLGAQDYLLKDELNEKFLKKSVDYSIERKKNLEEVRTMNKLYELIGSVTNEVVWTWDMDTNEIIYAKNNFLGYRDGTIENTLDWWLDKLHPEDRQLIADSVQEVVSKKCPSLQFEYRFRSASGSYHYMFSRGVLVDGKEKTQHRMVGAMMDISERKMLQDELMGTQLNLQRQLTEATILGQEKQKEEIGKELHDNINQILASVNLFLGMIIDNHEMKDDMLVMCKDAVRQAIDEVRKLSHALVPPSFSDNGLIETVQNLTDDINLTGIFNATLRVENFDEARLDNTRKLMLYRVVQEQVNNIIKYAKAGDVSICFKMTDGHATLTIQDNGVGFDLASKGTGIGMRNIENRVTYYKGHMDLRSAIGKGTTLTVSIPVK